MRRDGNLSAEQSNILGTGHRAYFSPSILVQQPAFVIRSYIRCNVFSILHVLSTWSYIKLKLEVHQSFESTLGQTKNKFLRESVIHTVEFWWQFSFHKQKPFSIRAMTYFFQPKVWLWRDSSAQLFWHQYDGLFQRHYTKNVLHFRQNFTFIWPRNLLFQLGAWYWAILLKR